MYHRGRRHDMVRNEREDGRPLPGDVPAIISSASPHEKRRHENTASGCPRFRNSPVPPSLYLSFSLHVPLFLLSLRRWVPYGTSANPVLKAFHNLCIHRPPPCLSSEIPRLSLSFKIPLRSAAALFCSPAPRCSCRVKGRENRLLLAIDYS